jgi:hypothetical protein
MPERQLLGVVDREMHERTRKLGGCVVVLLFAVARGAASFLDTSLKLVISPLGLLLGTGRKASASVLATVFTTRSAVRFTTAVAAEDKPFLSLLAADSLGGGEGCGCGAVPDGRDAVMKTRSRAWSPEGA